MATLAVAAIVAIGCDVAAPGGSPSQSLPPSAPAASPSSDPGAPRPTPTGLPAGSPLVSPSPSTSPPASTPPFTGDVPHDPAKFGFRAKGMTGEIMAFMPIGQMQYVIDEMNWDVVSTLAFFSLEATRDGRIREDGGWRAWNSERMDRLIAKAHANGSKVVMSLERFSWTSAQTALTRELLGSKAARDKLAHAVAAEVERRGVDGVNVDFEPIPVGRKAHFTELLRALRRELDARRPGYQLTFDIVGHHTSYDVAAGVGPDAADAVYLMGYHYAGTWSKIAQSNAPMGGPRYDVVDTVKSLLKSIERHELIVGVPYYGHAWPTNGSGLNARTLGGGFDVIYSRAVATARANGIRYDKVQQVAWSRWRARACASCPVTWYQMYFDDARASEYKWAWIKRNKLLGSGVWTIGFEGGPGALDAAMRKTFLESSPLDDIGG
ncbi:MAG TPA: glycosyl hydrolase family 18 protein [Candidatus Limnocylindrales bacterium]